MAVREELHHLVDGLPEGELHTAKRFLEYLRALEGDPLLLALGEAPEDDEPTTPEEDREADEDWQEYLRAGEAVSAEEAKRRLLP